jgi:glycosyltransferase involved in cell wall biosynthesis
MKLSIITVNYNDAIGLKKTIDSVVQQTFSDFEYIIIDGGSTDSSVDIIKENISHINYWVSEPDKGIYNAMNKGILAAKGEYLLFLNSGDWFCNGDVLSLFVEDTDGVDIIYGDWIRYYSEESKIEDRFPSVITFEYLALQNSLPHQAALIKKECLVDHGLYDEQLKIVSDWKFFLLAIFKWGYSYKHKPIFLVYFNKYGISSGVNNLQSQFIEREIVLSSEFPVFIYLRNELQKINKKLSYHPYSLGKRGLRKFKRGLRKFGLTK